jgi:hypothetical protein
MALRTGESPLVRGCYFFFLWFLNAFCKLLKHRQRFPPKRPVTKVRSRPSDDNRAHAAADPAAFSFGIQCLRDDDIRAVT